MTDWRTMYLSIFAGSGRRHVPTTNELDDIKRAMCDASRDIVLGDDAWPLKREVQVKYQDFSLGSLPNGLTDIYLAHGAHALLPNSRIKSVIGDDIYWLNDIVSLSGTPEYVIERVTNAEIDDLRQGPGQLQRGQLEFWAPNGSYLEFWPRPLTTFPNGGIRFHASIDPGVIRACYDGASSTWVFVNVNVSDTPVTDDYSSFLFTNGFNMMKARSEYHLWSNLWSDQGQAASALMRYAEAKKAILDSTVKRERGGYIVPYQLPGY